MVYFPTQNTYLMLRLTVSVLPVSLVRGRPLVQRWRLPIPTRYMLTAWPRAVMGWRRCSSADADSRKPYLSHGRSGRYGWRGGDSVSWGGLAGWAHRLGWGDQERLKSSRPKPVGRSWERPSIGAPVGLCSPRDDRVFVSSAAEGGVIRNAWSHRTRNPWADHGNAHPSEHRSARVSWASRSWCVAEGGVIRNAWSHHTRSPWSDHGNVHPSAHRSANVSS